MVATFSELEYRFPTIAGEKLHSVWDFCQGHPDLVRSITFVKYVQRPSRFIRPFNIMGRVARS